MRYDVEEFRMKVSSYALKKDTEIIENKLS